MDDGNDDDDGDVDEHDDDTHYIQRYRGQDQDQDHNQYFQRPGVIAEKVRGERGLEKVLGIRIRSCLAFIVLGVSNYNTCRGHIAVTILTMMTVMMMDAARIVWLRT